MGQPLPSIRVPASTPQEAILVLIGALDRGAAENAIEALIERLDRMDGDPDVEFNGDERDGCSAEDEAGHTFDWQWTHGPGCPVSDPGEEDDDDACPAGDDNLTDWGRFAGAVLYGCTTGIDQGTPGDPEDAELSAWTEWHTRGRHKLDRFGSENRTGLRGAWVAVPEDAEGDGIEVRRHFRDRIRAEGYEAVQTGPFAGSFRRRNDGGTDGRTSL